MAKSEKKPAAKSLTKSELFKQLSESTGLSKSDVTKFFDELSAIVVKSLSKRGGVITIPGLIRFKIQKKKAQKGGKLVPNRFKPGEFVTTKDRPASNKVKVAAVKALNDKFNSGG